MSRHLTRQLLAHLPLLALFGIQSCSSPDHGSAPAAPQAAATTPVVAPLPASSTALTTTPPSAAQLYQLVAPVALFPDPLLAQVLAASAHPDQIAAEANMLQQNPGLNTAALQAALTPQPWDPAVKGLASFPAVLDQMARSPAWTAALGQAYANDPTDLMNAVQALRQRALSQGHLKTTPQQIVVTRTVTTQTSTVGEVVAEPQAYVEIDPAQSDLVYVPSYDPDVVYGEDFGAYPGYYVTSGEDYPGWSDGLIGFGAGIAVGALLSHPWGWSHWGMHWGGPPPPGQAWGEWRAPSVYYDRRHYNVQNIHPGFAPGGGISPSGRGQAPQFDQHLNAHSWGPGGSGPAAGRNNQGLGQAAMPGQQPSFMHQATFQAHAGAAASPGRNRQPAFYSHSALGNPAGQTQGLHARTRSTGEPQQGAAWPSAQSSANVQRSAAASMAQGSIKSGNNQAFHSEMRTAQPSFHPQMQQPSRPQAQLHPVAPSRPAQQEHPHAGDGGHRH